ncbi:GAF domain-containing sensor histidine kinase [Methylobacterium dankookense]|uniref:histidine kinase n=1 Tax=Methylobacterium dankookense TaxID=560405 RepID=A0A564FRK7_9HYPH|nr:ATP-binding protein [Methylobacterium dankookense]GJD56333.1 Adaptive-response sensory-kinase SasA [Methylobacterium dankookense]VUF10346.1 Bacteriophytochrome [Methylobacterium dankookense]
MTEGLTEDAALVAGLKAVPGVLEVVRAATGMRFAAVARVTADRWLACAVEDGIGLGIEAGGELPVETTICREVRQAVVPVVISDARSDAVYCSHPTPSMYGFRSYVSTPIVLPGGSFFGVLCALDPEPRDLSAPWLLRMFKLHAELVAFQIDAHRRLAAGAADLATSRRDLATSQADLATSRADFAMSQADLATAQADLSTSAASLTDERDSSALREQFIAVLGHDLRNPLASIDAGAKLLAKENLSERGRGILDLVGKSVGRMAGLIDDVLDFARGRLGGGIAVNKADRVPLAPMLRQVVDELATGHPDRRIEVELDGIGDCRCDPARIGQLLSNLVANALTHGASDAPVTVRGVMIDGIVELSVGNAGRPISPEAMANLFQPFVRASSRPSQQGLGLGLYIASEIARAHGGTLTATLRS